MEEKTQVKGLPYASHLIIRKINTYDCAHKYDVTHSSPGSIKWPTYGHRGEDRADTYKVIGLHRSLARDHRDEAGEEGHRD